MGRTGHVPWLPIQHHHVYLPAKVRETTPDLVECVNVSITFQIATVEINFTHKN